MAVKKALSKELSDLISKYLSKGGKVKKLPAGTAKGATNKTNIKPKNLPRDKQGKTLKFDADGEVKFKDGGMTKKQKAELEKILGMSTEEVDKQFRKTLKRMGMLEKMDRAKELDGESRRRRRQLGEPTQKKLRNKPKSRPNQMDRNDPTGIQVKDGGMPKKKKEEFKDKGFYEYLDDVMNKKPKPKTKAKDKTKNKGVKIKNGGTLRVSKRGPLYKGKKSGPYS